MMIIEHSPLVRMVVSQQQHCCDRDAESRRCCEHEKSSHQDEQQQSDEEDLQRMADDASIWEDDDAAVLFVPANSKQSTPSSGVALETVWRLSVVYSETWRVPVLYFTVFHQRTGDPCTRAQVLEFLFRCQQQQQKRQNGGSEVADEDSSWDFVSVTEHPATGTPCFFLHPCRTSDRLQTLLQTTTPTTRTPNTADTSTSAHSAALLWSWFSLILPSLGLSIPPRTYLEVQQQLRGDGDDDESLANN